ncbi:Peroxidase [Quillaja saponaria]|uniref:Peroxidase n=1 Tax=Quillaja saponaria TaxID=32244 RepID=A0AAD7LLF2_QUISA|nr:Peroxidase [Quillaja saponaria]
MDFRSSSYNRGGYSLSSSNLSPLAPPFSVDRSNFDSNLGPYMDYTEPPYAPHNREPTCPPAFGHDLFRSPVTELESMPFSKGYGYSSLKGLDSPSTHLNYNSATSADTILYSQCLDSMRTSAVGATPYYPSYISPVIHNDSPTVPYNPASYDWTSTFQFATSDGSSHGEYAKNTLDSKPTAQWGGSWSGLAEWNQGKIKPVEPVGSFNSKTKNVADLSIDDNLANQGFHDFKASNSGDDSLFSINLLGLGNQNVPVSTGQSDDKSFLGKNSESMRFDFSRTSSIGPLSGTVPDAPLLVSSGNCQFAYGASYDKHLRQHDTQSLVSTASSVPMTGLFKDFNVGSDMADTDLRANNSGNVNEPHPIPSSESTVCFNPTQLSLHLERKDHALLTNNTDLSNRSASNALDHIFRAKAGLQIPHRSPDALSLALNNTNEVLDSAEKSIESIDRYNPPVDSPCWKGAPASRFSQFEAFSAPGPQYMKKSEEHFGWNLQEPQNFLFSMDDTMNFTENSGKNTMFHEINCFENGLAASLRMSSVTNLASEESKSNGAIKGKFFHSNPSCINEVSHPDGISEAGKNFVLPDKPTPLKTVQQSVKEMK